MKIWSSKKLKQKQGVDDVDAPANTDVELKSFSPDEMVLAGPSEPAETNLSRHYSENQI